MYQDYDRLYDRPNCLYSSVVAVYFVLRKPHQLTCASMLFLIRLRHAAKGNDMFYKFSFRSEP